MLQHARPPLKAPVLRRIWHAKLGCMRSSKVKETTGRSSTSRRSGEQLRSISKNEGYQRCDTPGVGLIGVSELLPHPALLDPQLVPQGACGQRKGEDRAQVAERQRRAEECKEQTRVDRVADEGVRPARDELVLFLDSHAAAPIPAQMQARPDGKQQPAGGQKYPNPERPFGRRQKMLGEQRRPHSLPGIEKDCDRERNDVRQPGWQGLPLGG